MCNDTTGWQNLLLPCDFQELLKSAKCGIYFIENSWRLQWTWSSSESTFCHFYYTVYRVYTSIARKSITLKSTLKAHLIIISGQHGHFIITSTECICTSYAGPWWQYIHHQRYLIHRVVLWDAKSSHVMADYFLFIRFFQSLLFFLSSRRLVILVCMYDIHTMLTCTHMSQIVTHVTIWKYRMINKIYLRSLYMEPYFVISWFSLIIRSCIIDFLYKWIITQDQIFNF